MNEETLNKLKQFEAILKQCLIKKFGSFLPENKISFLQNTEYIIGNELKDEKDRDKLQGRILRTMLDSIIDITCLKEISIDGINTTAIVYGRNLEDALIEYYAQELANSFHISINQIPELKDDLALVYKLREAFGAGLDSKVFNEDAIKLLNIPQLKEVALECDAQAVKAYLEKNAEAAEAKEDKEKDNNLFKGITTRSGSVQIVYLDEKKYIKYIDQDGKVHLIEAQNAEKVNDYYKEKVASLMPGEELDPEKLFKELCELTKEEELNPTKDIKMDEVNQDVANMIKFVDTSAGVKKETYESALTGDFVTHNNEGKIHVIEETNDIVTTNQHPDYVEAQIVKDGESYSNDYSNQTNADISSNKILTPEEYDELCMKYANNENLTEEELRALMRATPNLMTEEEISAYLYDHRDGPKLKMHGNDSTLGFAKNSMLIYFVFITLFIGLFIGALVFSFIN